MNIEECLKSLDEYDNAYYNGSALISDKEYDRFKDSVLRNLPPNHPRLKKVGHEPASSWPKTKLNFFMGSQNKARNLEEFYQWVDRHDLRKETFLIQDKIDGLSILIKYENGKLVQVCTRGDGEIGEDITKNALNFRSLPHFIDDEKTVYVRAEAYIKKEHYKLISGDYKNARNAAAGITRRYDGSQSEYISVIAYDISGDFKTEDEKRILLCGLGFDTPMSLLIGSGPIETLYDLSNAQKNDHEYEVDGLVIKVDDLEVQDRLGIHNNRPNGQIALKFDASEAETEILDIKFQIGRTGLAVPVAEIKPVDIAGATISRVNLHSLGYVLEKKATIGSKVLAVRRGEIIPDLSHVIENPGLWNYPKTCPSCDGPIVFDGANAWCENANCKAKELARILNWFETIGMKGFSESFFEKLYERGVTEIDKAYRVPPEIILDAIGGQTTVNNFYKELDRTSFVTNEVFLAALGVPGLGISKAEQLLKIAEGDIRRALRLQPSDIEKSHGFAETSSESIAKGLKEVLPLAEKLLSVVVIKQRSGKLCNKSFCVTGNLETMKREEFKNKVIDNGGVYKTSVSMGLDYLVTNNTDSGSGKNAKASKYGTKIINEKEFLNLIA